MERNCMGERYLGCGSRGETIVLNGVPGNALGAYLDGSHIIVNGNAQDATGDTMNEGSITIHGSTGDACGLGMRGGEIYVRDNAGYRAGIHMKAYQDKFPVLVVGGKAGSFLGEYQAGGLIMVLGLGFEGESIVGYYCGTGMHGGKIFLRTNKEPQDLPEQVMVNPATEKDMKEVEKYINAYCEKFGVDKAVVLDYPFYVLTPNTKNPYKKLYCYN